MNRSFPVNKKEKGVSCVCGGKQTQENQVKLDHLGSRELAEDWSIFVPRSHGRTLSKEWCIQIYTVPR